MEVFENMDLIPGLIGLTHVQNTGAAFSILSDQRWLLAGIAFVASVVLVFILLRYTDGFWGTIGLSAVLGGAVGNLVDRVMHGYVIDMFRFQFMNFAIFNIADIFITLGFITFSIHFIVSTFKTAAKERNEARSVSDSVGNIDEIISYPDEHGEPDYDDFSDTRVIMPRQSEPRVEAPINDQRWQEPQQVASYPSPANMREQMELPSWQEYYEPIPEKTPEMSSSLDTLQTLDALEAELGLSDDYDVEKLLREYGFEE